MDGVGGGKGGRGRGELGGGERGEGRGGGEGGVGRGREGERGLFCSLTWGPSGGLYKQSGRCLLPN